MSECKQIGQEIWICQPVQCISIPSTSIVLQGADTRFYPARFVEESESSSIEVVHLGGKVMSFEQFEDALFFILPYLP